MPCVFLLFNTQHSRLLEAAQELAYAAAAENDDWTDQLYRFRRSLVHHDRMEREVLRELGARTAPDELTEAFDRVMASQNGPTAETVAAAARKIGRIIEAHALAQEEGLFPTLTGRHPLTLRHQLGTRYFLSAKNRWQDEGASPAPA